LKVGKSVVRTLIVHNPHEYEQQVCTIDNINYYLGFL
jgi:hypothetical protein